MYIYCMLKAVKFVNVRGESFYSSLALCCKRRALNYNTISKYFSRNRSKPNKAVYRSKRGFTVEWIHIETK